MSSKSFSGNFERQPPVEKYYDAAARQKMMATLERRCAEVKAKKDSSVSVVSHAEHGAEATATAGGETQHTLLSGGLPQLSRPAAPGASSGPSGLVWNDPAKGTDTVYTRCGTYCCHKTKGSDDRRLYQLWRLLPQRQLIDGQCQDFKVAKLLAQRHADQA